MLRPAGNEDDALNGRGDHDQHVAGLRDGQVSEPVAGIVSDILYLLFR